MRVVWMAAVALAVFSVVPGFGEPCLDEQYRKTDVVSVWMSCEFLLGFIVDGEDLEGAAEDYALYSSKLIPLFEQGHLSGVDFHRAAGWSVPGTRTERATWDVPALVKILYAKEARCSGRSGFVCLDVWVTPYEGESGWGSFDHFWVEWDPQEPRGASVVHGGEEI
jgi:hypothetical protein